jgi:solute:Na+ symporter, SSS family
MQPFDVFVIVAYVVGCTALGAWLGSGAKGIKQYLLGERNIPAWAVMISIVATETSAVTFLSVPGIAYRQAGPKTPWDGDFAYLQLALGYIVARVFIAFVLLPLYFRGEIYTAYEVLAQRFGGATQRAASVLFLVTRTLASGLRLLLAAKVLEQVTGWTLPVSILIIGVSTIVYTLLGGLSGVIWADVLQFFVYLIAALIALAVLNGKTPGGLGAVVRVAGAAGKFRMFNFSTSLSIPYTFWAGVIGAMVLDTGTHGVDQTMVQRYLAARSRRQAAWALITSGFVVFAQFALFLFLGAAIWVFYQTSPPESPPAKDQEFASFIINHLPVGIKGLTIAAIFSVTMSTVSGALSASASSTVNDLFRPLFPNRDDKFLLRLSKWLTAFWGFVQVGVALGAIALQQSIVDNALSVAGFVTGILLGLFLLGILTSSARVGQKAAFVGMLGGLAAVSFVRFRTNVAYPWYALVGSTTVVALGWLASLALPATLTPPAPSPEAAKP